MKYYKRDANNKKIICLLCKHYCRLKKGQIGACGVNQNINCELKNLVYGHPSAINIDPIEKKPLYHFLPGTLAFSLGTVGCNFKCPFCQNWTISQTSKIDKTNNFPPELIVNLAIKYGCNSIAYTYNEPTVFYPYAKDIGVLAKKRGIKNIFVTNGFESFNVIEDMASWVDAANIDLKSWDEEYYKKVLKGGLQDVKECIKSMKKNGIWVEVTTLLIEGQNDSDKDIEEMAKFLYNEAGAETPWHLSAFHPDYKMKTTPRTKLQTLQRAYNIAKSVGMKYVYLGNVPIHNNTICPKCGEILIERDLYRIVKNELTLGKCPKCNTRIEGVWI